MKTAFPGAGGRLTAIAVKAWLCKAAGCGGGCREVCTHHVLAGRGTRPRNWGGVAALRRRCQRGVLLLGVCTDALR